MSSFDQHIYNHIKKSIQCKMAILDDTALLDKMTKAANVMVESIKNGGSVYFCGNGGSAADAQHLSAELSGRYLKNRKPLPSEALHTNTSALTAIANDFGFEAVYARVLEAIAHPASTLVCISTSGESSNIIHAATKANELGIKVIALLGLKETIIDKYSDIVINVPSDHTPIIQEAHIMIGHCLCELVENAFTGS